MLLAASTGLRHPIVGLPWRDVNLDAGSIMVRLRRSVWPAGGRTLIIRRDGACIRSHGSGDRLQMFASGRVGWKQRKAASC